MNRWEVRRKRVTTQVALLATEESDRDSFERRLKREFKAVWVGGGAAREVYALPCGLVVKVEYFSDQNNTEFRVSQIYPKLTPKIYAYVWGGRGLSGVPEYSVIIARKARVFKRVPGHNSKWYQRYRRLCRKFEDVFPCNVGTIGERLVLVDGGCGEGYTDYWTNDECW